MMLINLCKRPAAYVLVFHITKSCSWLHDWVGLHILNNSLKANITLALLLFFSWEHLNIKTLRRFVLELQFSDQKWSKSEKPIRVSQQNVQCNHSFPLEGSVGLEMSLNLICFHLLNLGIYCVDAVITYLQVLITQTSDRQWDLSWSVNKVK